ncbi:pentatricopeptide repeat-containing protein At1g80550, mitochondrial-like [Impatiens glandulifera]|uniref:pentatricopeptide repeat-containing protein At1g80550, mitochondrial-like n=1 Tax=Impatiens glandulifera TaxID=253017 RepID=UPI001FB16C54|nr:pentatricopeptide repeat-containing protein At1g80550, mitochondrial-like [Impatiens glandulifera]
MLLTSISRRLQHSPIQNLFTFLSRSFSSHTFSRRNLNQDQVLEPKCSSPGTNPIQEPLAAINSVDLDENTVLETLFLYTNDWQRAFEFFNWVRSDSGFQHRTDGYNRMIDILGKFFEFDLAWDLIDQMRRNEHSFPNHTTFRVLFKRYASAHLVQEALMAYDKSKEFNLKDEITFSHLIDALCEYKHVVEAEEICLGKTANKEIDIEVYLNTKIYNMILRGWLKMKWWSKCSGFWEEMDERGVEKDLFSYSIYMDIQCKCGKPWKAVRMYKEMKKKGIKLDVVAYNTVIHAIGQSEGVDFAVRIFHEMADFGCQPTVETFNAVIKLLCQNGRLREAHKLFAEMSKRGYTPDVVTYQSVFAYLEKPRQIIKLFDEMIARGVRPRLDTYVMLMRKFERWGFLRPVFVVWEKMEQHGLSPDNHAYNALIDALLQKGLTDMAKKYDEEMMAKGLSARPRVELGTQLDSLKSIST